MKKLNILIITAHPDDCEIVCGGFAILGARAGHSLTLVSMTNGDTGHYEQAGGSLARRRQAEAKKAASLIKARSIVFDIPSNELTVCLPWRWRLIELIRQCRADVIITHRTCDYHPDHRAAAQLVTDTSTAVTNPNICGLTPALRKTPVYLYAYDSFTQPAPFKADIVFDISSVIEQKLDCLNCHASQMYEWLPWDSPHLGKVPPAGKKRRDWLRRWRTSRDALAADTFRAGLVDHYGEKKGTAARFAEAFSFAEYGSAEFRALHKARRLYKDFFSY